MAKSKKQKIVAGNWKMNTTLSSAITLAEQIAAKELPKDVIAVLCTPSVFAAEIGKIIAGKPILNPKQTSALAMVWMPLVDLHELEMYPNVGAELQRYYLKGRGIDYVGRIGQRWF